DRRRRNELLAAGLSRPMGSVTLVRRTGADLPLHGPRRDVDRHAEGCYAALERPAAAGQAGPASKREDRLTGLHANTQIPKFIGAARQYELTGKPWLKTAATFFWETVVRERSYVIGGHSLGEFFTPKDKLSQALGPNTCETCNTYNMLKLTRH